MLLLMDLRCVVFLNQKKVLILLSNRLYRFMFNISHVSHLSQYII